MKNYIIGSIFIIIVLIIIVGCSYNSPTIEKEQNVMDGINFKAEFENASQEKFQLLIEKENPFKYLNEDNMEGVFQNTNIIFLGYPESNISRAVVKELLDLSKELEIEDIYYYNVLNNRSQYILTPVSDKKENEDVKEPKYEITKTKEQTKSFEKIKTYLKKYLAKQTITDSNGKKYEVPEKTILAPAIVFIKDGKITSYYSNFPKKEQEEFIGFNEKDLKKLKDNLVKLIENIKN